MQILVRLKFPKIYENTLPKAKSTELISRKRPTSNILGDSSNLKMAELSDLSGLSSISDITLTKMNDSIQGTESCLNQKAYRISKI